MNVLNIEECFEILKEKLNSDTIERDDLFKDSINAIEKQEDKLTKDLSRITYTLDDGWIYLFLRSSLNEADSNVKPSIRAVQLYAKISESGSDVLKHSESREILSFEKSYN